MKTVPSEPSWHYALHGLTFHSSLPLNRVEPAAAPIGEPEVRIRFGDVPERLASRLMEGFRWEVSADAALLDVLNVGRILITPREVILNPLPTASLEELSFAVLAAAVPPLLFLRRIMVLHAAAVRFDGRAVAIAGTSGVGKSTTLFACLRRGGEMVTDDIAAVHFGEADPQIHLYRGAPGVKLWPDALSHYTVSPDDSEPIRPAAVKRVVQTPLAVPASTPLAAVVILETHLTAMQCTRITGRTAFTALRAQLHGPRMVHALDHTTAFRQVATVAGNVPIFVLKRPDDLSGIEQIVDTILAVSR